MLFAPVTARRQLVTLRFWLKNNLSSVTSLVTSFTSCLLPSYSFLSHCRSFGGRVLDHVPAVRRRDRHHADPVGLQGALPARLRDGAHLGGRDDAGALLKNRSFCSTVHETNYLTLQGTATPYTVLGSVVGFGLNYMQTTMHPTPHQMSDFIFHF